MGSHNCRLSLHKDHIGEYPEQSTWSSEVRERLVPFKSIQVADAVYVVVYDVSSRRN